MEPSGTGPVIVLMDGSQFGLLVEPGRYGNLARATACHEIGHVVLHAQVIRRRRQLLTQLAEHVLQRVVRHKVPAYRCAEWQVGEFARRILILTATLQMLRNPTASEVAELYGVSERLAELRLKKERLR